MKLEKYHGLGNTFLITSYKENINYSKLSSLLCNEKSSIGADGLIVTKVNPLEMLIYNKDGSEAIMCGNGLRCFLHYCFLSGYLKNKNENIEVRTKSGVYTCRIISYSPFMSEVKLKRSLVRKEVIGLYSETYESYYVKVGVRHNVIFVTEENKDKIELLIDNFNKYQGFCEETNIDIVKKIDDSNLKVITYERGVGYTSSCGTGVVASCLVANYLYGCSSLINVENEYGVLKVNIDGDKVLMKGPSVKVCNVEVEYA